MYAQYKSNLIPTKGTARAGATTSWTQNIYDK